MTRAEYRRRSLWLAWAAVAAGAAALITLALGLLIGWPPAWAWLVCLGLPVALAAALSASSAARWVDRLLVHTIWLAGLATVVVGVYLLVVLGLGRVPSERERTILALSMAAAGVAVLLAVPARARLIRVANRVVYGERHAPDAVLRTFGSRLSRATPLDELLLQLVESLRETMALESAAVLTGSDGVLELTVSEPDRGPLRLTLSAEEESVVARAGVSGMAWARIWLAPLVAGREHALIRVAPITHAGALYGLIVVERPGDEEPFTDEDERVLAELARQVGVALHNVRLDSALQTTLAELRRQAGELRASRARIVAAADAERRRIERDLHDSAQQRLVALSAKLRLAQELAAEDATEARAVLDELGGDITLAIEELRELAHGIYPPLLVEGGLADAISGAAARAPLPATVEVNVGGRYPLEIEAAVYFCCTEALQNAAKHAGAGAQATIRIWEEAGALLFEVADDGAGFDPGRNRRGAGFTNMSDRLGAFGGTLGVESTPGAGTTVRGAIPLPRSPGEKLPARTDRAGPPSRVG